MPSAPLPPGGDGTKPATVPASNPDNSEEEMRLRLRKHLSRVTGREPLDPSYRHALIHGAAREPAFPKDKLYKRLGAELRSKVESHLASGGENDLALGRKRGRDRENLDEGPMRAAFTLRECKRHEQEGLIAAALSAPPPGMRLPPGIDVAGRRRRLEAIALGLQEKEKRTKAKAERSRLAATARVKILAAEREAEAERVRSNKSAGGGYFRESGDGGVAAAAAALVTAERTRQQNEVSRERAEAEARKREEKEKEERQRSIDNVKEREKDRREALRR